jgi:predicted MFS family arabinose efflux permease
VLALSAVLIALFAGIEARSAAPLVPLRIFRSRALVGGNLVLLALGMVAFGMPFILTQYAQQVLGYSAVEFGLSSAVMPVMAAVGSVAGQAIVTKTGFRPIAAAGMILAAVSCALLTQVSVDGSYFDDIFLGLLIFGPGLGAAFVASSIATLAGVAEAESGLASGLNNTSFQIGSALGVAILSTVAVSQAEGAEPLAALTEGFQSAFAAAVVFPALGLLVALLLLGRVRRPLPIGAEPAAAPALT